MRDFLNGKENFEIDQVFESFPTKIVVQTCKNPFLYTFFSNFPLTLSIFSLDSLSSLFFSLREF